MKRFYAMLLALALLFSLAACGNSASPAAAPAGDAAAPESQETEPVGTVRFFNDQPQIENTLKDLASRYTAQSGVEVVIESAAGADYEDALAAALAGEKAPTLFILGGEKALDRFGASCLDLGDSEAAAELISDHYALHRNGAVVGLPCTLETYGLATNQTLLAQAGYTIDNINCLEDLQKVAQVITARGHSLGFAAFTSAGLDTTSEPRFNTVLASLPIAAQLQEGASGAPFTDAYLDNLHALWDLYLDNATCKREEIAGKTAEDSRFEFCEGKAVFYQTSAADYDNLKNSFDEDELTMIPLYFGVGDEAYQGLITGAQHYWCVNGGAAAEDLSATLDFLAWLLGDASALSVLTNQLGWRAPYRAAAEPDNRFERAERDLTLSGRVPVALHFDAIPSENWKYNLSASLAAYADGTGDWEGVVAAFTAAN